MSSNYYATEDYPDWQLYLVEPHDPDDPVVSLEDAKKHLRVNFEDDDDLIEGLVESVVSYLDGKDGYLKRALLDQTWDLKLSCFPCHFIQIPLPPLIEVVSISYVDADGVTQALDLDDYHITGVGGSDCGKIYPINGVTWPTVGTGWPEPVTVRFRAGYLDTSVSPAVNAVPASIIAAIKLTLGTLYDNREGVVVGTVVSKLPDVVEAMLSGNKVYR